MQHRNNWVIVLAGGEGSRLRPFIHAWLGSPIPKQYCAFVGRRSMLQHTVARASSLVPDSNIVTILGHGHSDYLPGRSTSSLPGIALEQPRQRGTLNGILLAGSYILDRDPEARILILPSDHFVFPESRFRRQAMGLFSLLDSLHDSMLLMGVEAQAPETEYGWIHPGERQSLAPDSHLPTFRVRRFLEKPGPEDARRFLRHGFLWNTMITAMPLSLLWSLCHSSFPHCMVQFEFLKQVFQEVRLGCIPAETCEPAMGHVYDTLKSIDFSHDLLQRVPERILVQRTHKLRWSDWGRLERIVETLDQLDRVPHFITQPKTWRAARSLVKAG